MARVWSDIFLFKESKSEKNFFFFAGGGGGGEVREDWLVYVNLFYKEF